MLLLDEPVSALDASTRGEALSLLRRLQRERGLAMLLISHDLHLVRDVADRVAVMLDGRIVETGATPDVL